MARKALITGPIVFFTDEGNQETISPDWLSFDGATLEARLPSRLSPTKLLPWLRYQASLGRIVPAPAEAPEPTLRVDAAREGPYGNNIEFTVAPGSITGRVDVTASVTDRYEGLTLATIKQAIEGTAAHPRRGLMRVKSVGTDRVQVLGPIEPDDPAVTLAPAGSPPVWTLSGTPGDAQAMALEPSDPGPEFALGQVDVVVNAVDGPEFTLTVEWANTVRDLDPDGLVATAFDPLRFLVTVAAPDPPGSFKAPRHGTTRLSGGHEASAATTAGTTLSTND